MALRQALLPSSTSLGHRGSLHKPRAAGAAASDACPPVPAPSARITAEAERDARQVTAMVKHILAQPSSLLLRLPPPLLTARFWVASSELVLLMSGLPKHNARHYCVRLLAPLLSPPAASTALPLPRRPGCNKPWVTAGALSERDGEPRPPPALTEAPGRSPTPLHHCMMKAPLLHRFTAAGAWPRAEGRELDQMVQAELTQ